MSNTELITVLQNRFNENMKRHENLNFDLIAARLESKSEKLQQLHEMERTGGEPDVIALDEITGEYIFCDCSAESPEGRRNVCYDGKGEAERNKKGVYPEGNAVDMAEKMGIELLSQEQYKQLQMLGNIDTKTSSWIKTPSDIRKLGGALFADFRYGHVFIYHNSAPSFYSSRGFRGLLRV